MNSSNTDRQGLHYLACVYTPQYQVSDSSQNRSVGDRAEMDAVGTCDSLSHFLKGIWRTARAARVEPMWHCAGASRSPVRCSCRFCLPLGHDARSCLSLNFPATLRDPTLRGLERVWQERTRISLVGAISLC